MFQILIFNTGEIIDFWSTVSAIKIFFAKQQQIKCLQYLHFGIIFRFINTINLKIETLPKFFIDTDLSGPDFLITDPNGVKYYFGSNNGIERSKTISRKIIFNFTPPTKRF